MDTFAGTTLTGSQPAAGRARSMHVCVSGQSIAAAAAWLHATKPAFRTLVPDTYGRRRPRGTT